MPCRHVTDHQMRLFMQHRQTDAVAAAAIKKSMSKATGHQIARTSRACPRPARCPAAADGQTGSARF